VIDRNANTLTSFDVTNPAAPVLLNTIATGTDPWSIAINNNYAYVLNFVSNTMSIYNISNPASMTLANTIAAGNGPHGITILNGWMYVVAYADSKLYIYDMTLPTSPTVVSSVAVLSGPYAVTVSGIYAYVVGTSNIMSIVNVNSAYSPSLVTNVATSSYAFKVAVSGNYAFITNQTGNSVSIYNISNPLSVTLASTLVPGASPQAIQVVGNYAYVTGQNYFKVYSLACPSQLVYDPSTGNLTPHNAAEVDPKVGITTINGVPKWNGTALVAGSITDNGNVGVNTTTPVNNLDVNGAAAIGTYAGVNAAPAGGLIVSGNVGVGTNNPGAKLDVNGTVKSTGLTVNGAIQASSWASENIATNGYVNMGGIKIQWGQGSYVSNGAVSVTFPSAFTNLLSITATVDAGNDQGLGSNVPCKVFNTSNTGFQYAGTVTFNGDLNSKVRWIAIGN
jgi:hypothetical protein